MKYPDLLGRTVLITGADRQAGIGAAVCRAFAEQGCKIFFTSYQAQAEADFPFRLAKEIRDLGIQAESVDIDLARPESADTLLDHVYRVFGDLSILINNAAHGARDGFEQLSCEILDAHYKVNLRAPALLSVAFARRFSASEGGRIIILTSGQDLGPMPDGLLAYAATKGALAALTRSLAKELAGKGITVNAIDPGPTDTGWMTPALKAQLSTESGSGRVGTPEDAARLIVFLASAAGGWINGQVIHSRGLT